MSAKPYQGALIGCGYASWFHLTAWSRIEEVDIVAVPSLREPFGRVAVEGMLAGRPVIASDIDGLRSIVVDGGTGQLVAPGDPQDLARAISSLAGRPELRAQLGRAGRRRALDRFSITRTAEEVL